MKVLIIDDKVPDPSFCAGFPRAYRLLMSLINSGNTIYFIPSHKGTIKSLNVESLANRGVYVHDGVEKLKDEQIDVAILCRPHNTHYYMPIVREHLPATKIVYDTEALWYRRYDLQLAMTGRLPGWAFRYDEVGMARKADLCFVVNAEEKSILEATGVDHVVILGHSLRIHDGGLVHAHRKDMLVVGGILEADSSNEDALWYYLQMAWEEVHKKTGANLHVSGRATSPRILDNHFPGLELLGHVPDLVPYYETHRVFVAATRFSTGIPWKCHESMAHGIPNVISPLLASQLGVIDGVEALVGHTPAEYVEKSVALYEDPALWNKIRKNAFSLIHHDCNPERFDSILQTSLEAVCSPTAKPPVPIARLASLDEFYH